MVLIKYISLDISEMGTGQKLAENPGVAEDSLKYVF